MPPAALEAPPGCARTGYIPGVRNGGRILALGLAVGLLLLPAGARAADPVIIPGGTTMYLDTPPPGIAFDTDCVYTYGQTSTIVTTLAIPRGMVLSFGGPFSLCPLQFTDWLPPDNNNGTPNVQRTFSDAGVYVWSSKTRPRSGGTVYVVGPRAVLTATPTTAPDWTKPLTFSLDASGSYTVDTAAHAIVHYRFDLDGDGVFETDNGTNPVAQVTLPGPGTYRPSVRVTDDAVPARNDDETIQLDYPRPASPFSPGATPTETSTATPSPRGLKKATRPKLKTIAPARLKRVSLLGIGYVMRVLGLLPADKVRVTLVSGKRTLAVKTANGDGFSTRRTVRLKAKRSARAAVRRLRKGRKLTLVVRVTGSDGFAATRRKVVKVRG